MRFFAARSSVSWSVPVDSRVFMRKRALRKHLADSGCTDVVKPGGRQYTLKHGKVLVEAVAATTRVSPQGGK